MPASHIATIVVAAGLYLSYVTLAVVMVLRSKDAMDPTMWAAGWPHEPPDKPLSGIEAHLAMQRHLSCDPSYCARKAAAINVLRRSGKLVPDLRMSEVCR
ncbi:hypothetical protein NDR87_31085 [Nocardia sp. CDC159]|uniref:Uncharacterized protein n=1 Tax=Nocardia pulmonis TaxID=2951408 RepID=A0A9X2EBS9_9NOCA|nr:MULTISPECIES: hypothetical protein [Nocardia]MCM6778004.1 hypothetical protein [Nocardia pulmonis]MCM6790825.1 hypothetical protein [Nocardia sp. CDC159]